MTLQRHKLDLNRPFLRQLARWLLACAPRGDHAQLSRMLVLLPGIRPCATLKHLLLEESGHKTLLLPQITTPRHWVEDLAGRLGLLGRPVPPDDLRATLLAQRLPQLDWVAEHPESAPGLAEELIDRFDEIRRYGRQTQLLDSGTADPAPDQPDLPGPKDPAAAVVLHQDLLRIQAAWRLYRQVVPFDSVDRLLAVIARISQPGTSPMPHHEVVAVAGFTILDPMMAALLRRTLPPDGAHLLELACDDPLSRLLLAAYADADSATHPLTPERRLIRSLESATAGPTPTAEPPVGAGSPALYRERLQAAVPGLRAFLQQGRLELLACGDPEQESRAIASVVVEALRDGQRGRTAKDHGLPRIAIATADRQLAQRVAAQLRDAGIDADDTGGIPLSQQPAGVLAHVLLRAVVTDFQHGPLLEVLTHPFVDLYRESGLAEDQGVMKSRHARQVLRFERMIRGKQRPAGGLDSYRRLAAEWDDHVQQLWNSPARDMSEFIQRLESAFAPLSMLHNRVPAPWPEHLAAFRKTWANLAPGRPLDSRISQKDEATLVHLLDRLDEVFPGDAAGHQASQPVAMPPTTLSNFSATLSRLVEAQPFRPHRSQFLPVQITGLLEARLEHYDLLILAGMSEDIFPGRLARPLFLNEISRQALGLPNWRDKLAEAAELFLRLIHNGSEVIITWPTEKLGEPTLPSPLVVRLGMSGLLPCTRAAGEPPYRRSGDEPPQVQIRQAQTSFASEPASIPVEARARPLKRLSYSGIKVYRDCPYRFLLERGFGLKEQEEVLEEFRRLDYGQLVHTCLQRFLQPGQTGQQALAHGDRTAALRSLERITTAVFGQGIDPLPQRRLWQETFLGASAAIVDFELERFAGGWRPALLEGSFRLPLSRLRQWLLEATSATAATAQLPDIPPEAQAFMLSGVIDRVDLLEGNTTAAAVIDYKTGQLPSPASVADGRELQIVLYALAVQARCIQGLAPGAFPRVTQGAYYRISKDGSGFSADRPHLPADTPEGQEILWHGAREILQLSLAARDRNHPHPLIPGYWGGEQTGALPCGLCPFDGVCRLEERTVPPHLDIQLRKELSARRRG